MKKLHYYLTDVFTDRMFGGNPLAVVPDGTAVEESLYQTIAREFNLSETTFVLPSSKPGADFKLKIFTPAFELPMAGHPTIGTARVLRETGFIPKDKTQVTIEEGVGNILVEFEKTSAGEIIWMNQPLPRFGKEFGDKTALAAMLSLDKDQIDPELTACIVTTGVPYLCIPVRDLKAMKKIRARTDLYEKYSGDFGYQGLMVFTRETEHAGSTVHARMFAPTQGFYEDPATGSAAGPLGALLTTFGLTESGQKIICEQGFEMGRPSILYIKTEKKDDAFTSVKVGGQAVFTGEGHLFLQ